MKKNHILTYSERVGLFLLALPFTIFFLMTISEALLSISARSDSEALKKFAAHASDFQTMILGGVLMVLFIGIVFIGLRSLFEDKSAESDWDQRSGKKDESVLPAELKKLTWNWGAAGLNIFWAIYHRV